MGSKIGSMKVAAKRLGISFDEYIERINNGYKACTVCRNWKAISEYDSDKSRGDGLKSKCRKCAKALWRESQIHNNKARESRRDGDVIQARSRINHDVENGLRPNPNELYCALCGHKGNDKRHEYHHLMGYSKEHHYDVIALCTSCHKKEHSNGKN